MDERNKKILSCLALPLLLTASCSGDGGEGKDSSSEDADPAPIARVTDERDISDFEFTRANLVSYDEYGRFMERGDVSTDKKMGMFYFLWHGSHETGFYDNTKIEKELPGATLDPDAGEISPVEAFHYWGEPLYGYYSSADPFVLTRHAELLTLSGVQYILFDGTNGFEYMPAATALCEVFLKFQQQGFNVPKIGWYTNTHSDQMVDKLYNNFYSKGLYEDLWYKVEGKPFIVSRTSLWSDEQYAKYKDFFYIKESQWPDDPSSLSDGFPWMSFDYPQDNFDGTISVSAAQGPGLNMADSSSAWGRGYDVTTAKNDSENFAQGKNFDNQWQSALNPSEDADEVENVFVTGWNEWMAVKQNRDGKIYFCDQYNEEYSRDVEMENGVLGDSAYLQLGQNAKKWLYTEGRHYSYEKASIDMDEEASWEQVRHSYLDFRGDALKRDFKKAPLYTSERYTDDSARNDIASVKVTHDSNNLYFRIETDKDITSPSSDDSKWMNVFINSFAEGNERFGKNFDYRLNMSRDQEKLSIAKYANGSWTKVGDASYRLKGKTLQIALPLSLIGKSEDECHISFKVTDNVTSEGDIMNYYVTGDSAPIGRLSYEYGY